VLDRRDWCTISDAIRTRQSSIFICCAAIYYMLVNAKLGSFQGICSFLKLP